MMSEQKRRDELARIQEHDEPYMTGIRIRYQGEMRTLNAYKIPLRFLIYNKYNGRIASLVKSHERDNRELNAESEHDAELIEGFLLKSKEGRNESTLHNLLKNGQQKYGIVTSTGVIIDGNRRAMLLNQIWRNHEQYKKYDLSHAEYFIAVILPEGTNEREINKLETVYQMGEDEKLDYNPIEKYLKCKDLHTVYDFSTGEIAAMMEESEAQIIEWLEIMKLMDEYLDTYGYTGVYTRLEKREGQFVDLHGYLRRYSQSNNSTGSAKVGWTYTESDLQDLKYVCFDYIRAQYEGKEFRLIARPSKDGIFCNDESWKLLLDLHEKHVGNINSLEPTVDELRSARPDMPITKLLEQRDDDWTAAAKLNLERHLNRANERLQNLNLASMPMQLAERALYALQSINDEIESFVDPKLSALLQQIGSIAYNHRKTIEKALKKPHKK